MSEKNAVEKYLDSVKFLIKQMDTKQIEPIVNRLKGCIDSGNKILICGNGGSAADASHFAGELVCRFRKQRKALPALALTVDAAVLTAIGNDISFDSIFARQVESIGKPGDVLVAITTSGKSANVIKAANTAAKYGLSVISLTSSLPEKPRWADLSWLSNTTETSHTQEQMLIVIHAICLALEDAFAEEK